MSFFAFPNPKNTQGIGPLLFVPAATGFPNSYHVHVLCLRSFYGFIGINLLLFAVGREAECPLEILKVRQRVAIGKYLRSKDKACRHEARVDCEQTFCLLPLEGSCRGETLLMLLCDVTKG